MEPPTFVDIWAWNFSQSLYLNNHRIQQIRIHFTNKKRSTIRYEFNPITTFKKSRALRRVFTILNPAD